MAGVRGSKVSGWPSEADDAARCLGFVNTLSARPTAEPTERLVSYESLAAWAKEAGVLRADEAADLTARARRRATEAASVLTRALDLRELLQAVFVAAEHERTPPPAVLSRLAEYLAGGYARGRLVGASGTLQWVYGGGEDDLDRVLWEMARAAGRFVGSPALTRVRACAAADCAWWFVDDTKNGRRRWCDMKVCGNREKLRRFRARQR